MTSTPASAVTTPRTLVGNAFRQGFYWPRADLRGLLVLRPEDAPPGPRSADHTHHVVICHVGAGPRQPVAEGARGLHPLVGSNRQILQVDLGSTHRQD